MFIPLLQIQCRGAADDLVQCRGKEEEEGEEEEEGGRTERELIQFTLVYVVQNIKTNTFEKS